MNPEPASAADPCPSPLAWQEVLGDFREQAASWGLDRPKYRLAGRTWGAGTPLYLLGGFGGTHEIYALLAWLLRDQFRCVLLDYPGTSTEGATGHRASLAELAADVSAVAGTCGDEAIDLYAPSFGALVALQTMLDFPRLVRRTILQGGFCRRQLSPFERFLVRSCRFYPGPLRGFPGSRAVRRHNHRRWFPPFDESRWEFLEGNAGEVPVAALAWQAALIRDADLRSRLPEVGQPVLLIETEGEGKATRDSQRELAEQLPAASIETLLGTGQYPFLTHPHRLAKLIRQFLN